MNVFHFFSLVNTQATMSLKAEASRLYFSYLWWILEPIMYALVFYVVFEVFLKLGRENFLLFLMCGKIPFLWFSKSVTAASSSILQNKGIINQVHIPKALFPHTAVHEALYKQWAVFLVLFFIVIGYGLNPELNWLWLLPLILVQYLLILVCSLIGAFLVSFVTDFLILIQMGMMFLLFSSGIFWDINAIQNATIQSFVITFNPLAFLIDSYRAVLMQRDVYDINHLLVLGFVLVTLLILVHWLLARTSNIIAARVLSS